METVDSQSGVTVRMIREGVYTWSVSVAAEDNNESSVRKAKAIAVQICQELEIQLRSELVTTV